MQGMMGVGGAAGQPPDPYIHLRSPHPAAAAHHPPLNNAPLNNPSPSGSTYSSIPPMFLLAIVIAVIGIPLFLIANGALTTSKENLESNIRGTDTSGYGAGDDAGEDEGREKRVDKGDMTSGPLDISDLKGLGGLVGVAALVVIAFAMFPEEIDGALKGMMGNGIDLPLVGNVGGNVGESFVDSQAPPSGTVPPVNQRYQDPRTGQQYDSPPGPYDNDPRYPSPRDDAYDRYGRVPNSEYPPYDYGYDDPYAYAGMRGAPGGGAGAGAGGMFGGSSMMEMLMLCKIAPSMCEGMVLPGMPGFGLPPPLEPAPSQKISIDSGDASVDITLESGNSGNGIYALPTSSVERHLAMLRAQPILLIGYSTDGMEEMLIYIAFGAILPMLYAFGEILSNAYTHDDEILIDDRVADAKEKALKEKKDMEGEQQVTEAELGYYTKLWNERKAEIEVFAEKPWYESNSWQPPWTEEDREIEMENDPDGLEMFGSSEAGWAMKRAKGWQKKYIPVRMGAKFAEMNLTMKKLEATKILNEQKIKRTASRWEDDKRNLFPGMDPVGHWRETSRKTLERQDKPDPKLDEARDAAFKASTEQQEARALLKFKKEGAMTRGGHGEKPAAIAPTPDQKKKFGFHLKLWDERKKDDKAVEDEQMLPKVMWLKKAGQWTGDSTLADSELTEEQREIKRLDEQIEKNKLRQADDRKEYAKGYLKELGGTTGAQRMEAAFSAPAPKAHVRTI